MRKARLGRSSAAYSASEGLGAWTCLRAHLHQPSEPHHDDAGHDRLRAPLDLISGLQPSPAASVLNGGPDDPDTTGLVRTLPAPVGRVFVDTWLTGVATR